MRALAAVVLALAFLLGGCAGSGGQAPVDEFPGADALGLEATSTTGIIRGVVIDEAIRPLADAVVTLVGNPPQETRSNADGLFGFQGLAAGTYFLSVSKLGYFEVQQSAEVAAGLANPPVVKVQLLRDVAGTPFVQTFVFEGFIECSTNVVAACSAPNVGVQILDLVLEEAGLPPSGIGNVTSDNFIVWYVIDRLPDLVQTELVWQSTQALGNRMTLIHSYSGKDHIGIQGSLESSTGTSPVLLQSFANEWGDIDLGNETDLVVRVFAGEADEAGGTVGATVEQRFTAYTHVFYGYLPPETWRFSSGEPLPPPG